ncbi:hypothetical protein ACNOYE_12270 [Nannocystaceae bacterium ST9]
MKTSPFMASMASMFTSMLLFGSTACGDKPSESADETGTAGETATESGTADEVGDSGTTSTTTDSTSTTDTSDTDACPIGSDGCPCTDGGGCDPNLVCEAGTCGPAPADTGTTDTGTDTTTDTGTDTTDTTTTDTGDPPPYQACPNGDADCLPGEVCVTGLANQGQLPWTMCTSGMCASDDDCAVDDNDICTDLPGDGQPLDYCVPLTCDMQNPCPDPMQCAISFGGGNPSVCVWPD